MVKEGFAGVCCVEAGGPSPGLGCAGRGIIAALEILEKKGAYEKYRPDVVIYDVLGDADQVFIITSGENMAIHAGANIAMAVENFKDRGYAQLGGLILNRRNVKNEDAKVEELAEDIHSKVIGTLSRSALVTDAEEQKKIQKWQRSIGFLQEKSVHFVESKKLNMKDLQGGIYFA